MTRTSRAISSEIEVLAEAREGDPLDSLSLEQSNGMTSMSADDLADLMRTFNNVTDVLQQTHETLHAEVRRLKRELKATNEQLIRSRELAALGQMAAGIAHEIRNPLGSIRLYASMLSKDLEGCGESRRMADRIEQATVDLDSIVSDVLAFARHNEPRFAPIDAAVLLRQAVDGCVSLLYDREIEVVCQLCEGTESERVVAADSGLMNQALGNVVRNAIEAVGLNGRIELSIDVWVKDRSDIDDDSDEDGEGVLLVIRDTGPGIDAASLEQAFNPFYTTKATGTGLGLAIAHRIVDAHGGMMLLENHPDGGTSVEIGLRRWSPTNEMNQPTRGPNSETGHAGACDDVRH